MGRLESALSSLTGGRAEYHLPKSHCDILVLRFCTAMHIEQVLGSKKRPERDFLGTFTPV